MKYLVFCIKLLAFTLIVISLFSLNTKYKILNTVPEALAQTMSNANYILRFGNFNTAAGKTTTGGFTLNLTVGQTAPGLYTGTNFKVRAGFQYIKSIIPFSFSISQTNIDFGTISPTIAVTRSNNLTVSNGSAFGYTVTASENHPLLVPSSGQMIPDTACNSGACNTTTAALWNDPNTFGFGYRCDNLSGADCDSQFTGHTDFYRPFAASPSAVTVMSSINVGRGRQTQITYKLNISNTQAAGLYTNVINFIATPSF
ncbi:MAG: hypothetical protein M1444_01575 [Patescibacteria group bacterium]|nr:hypothetical protein [Patescibacteria group bacterium]